MYDNQGIYKITNTINGKIYIGSTINFDKRVYDHISKLNNNSHYNFYLQNDWNRYGSDSFRFEIIEIVNEDNLLDREQYWLDFCQSYKRNIGYNINNKADRSCMTEETKEKLRLMGIGRKMPESMKQKIKKHHANGVYDDKNKKQLGKKVSEETRRRMKLAHVGKEQSAVKCMKCSMSKMSGNNPNYKPISNDIIGKIKRLCESNYTVSDISRKVGYSQYKVRRFLIENNLMKGNVTWPTSKWL
jgi:group I intron endonuclease